MEPEQNRARARGQRGETLLESLLAIVILSMIVAGSYAGLQVAMKASVQQSESAVAGVMLSNAAEMLQDPESDYVDRAGCPGAGRYEDLPAEPGYGTVVATVHFIEPPTEGIALKSTSASAAADRDGQVQCPETDPGLQEIDLEVTTPSGRSEELHLIKRRQ